MSKHPKTVFGRRLREARERRGLPQDKLGVLIGLDEGCSSARISRYESGIHEPPFPVSTKMANILEVPVAYLYCADDEIAALLFAVSAIPKHLKSKALLEISDVIAKYTNSKN